MTVLVVGATGKVGHKVVERLVAEGVPIRCAVRDPESEAAHALRRLDPKLELVTLDLARSAPEAFAEACTGVSACIAVSGSTRTTSALDFLPWRFFGSAPSDDPTHPFFVNYVGIASLAAAAKRAGVARFVRLTGLAVGLRAVHPVAALLNLLLSCGSMWQARGEAAVRAAGLASYTVLRPGGLRDAERSTGCGLLVSRQSALAPPGLIGRSDVASLAVLAALGRTTATHNSTLSVAWGRPDGVDGAPRDWAAALDQMAVNEPGAARDRMDATAQPVAPLTAALAYAVAALAARLVFSAWTVFVKPQGA